MTTYTAYGAKVTVAGTTYAIHRDVAHTHAEAVHTAMGTDSEGALQHLLDNIYVDDWYGADGRHLGPDETGLELFWLDDDGKRIEAAA